MAVSANQLHEARNASHRNPVRVAASKTIYANTMVFGASGYATDVIASGANPFLGIAVAEMNNASGSAGDVEGEVYSEGVFYLTGSSFTQATVGVAIYASDNATVTASSSNTTLIGKCVEFVSSTKIGVKIAV